MVNDQWSMDCIGCSLLLIHVRVPIPQAHSTLVARLAEHSRTRKALHISAPNMILETDEIVYRGSIVVSCFSNLFL